MINKNIRMSLVNNFSVKTRLDINSDMSLISGEVYPFVDKFFSVKFSASIKLSVSSVFNGAGAIPKVDFSIAFSGNEFSNSRAIRIADATQVAIQLAAKYGELMETLANPASALKLMRDQLCEGKYDDFSDSLYLYFPHDEDEESSEKNKVKKNNLTMINKLLLSDSMFNAVSDADLNDDSQANMLDVIARKLGKNVGNVEEDQDAEYSRRLATHELVKSLIAYTMRKVC